MIEWQVVMDDKMVDVVCMNILTKHRVTVLRKITQKKTRTRKQVYVMKFEPATSRIRSTTTNHNNAKKH
jgi:hypothetical protein